MNSGRESQGSVENEVQAGSAKPDPGSEASTYFLSEVSSAGTKREKTIPLSLSLLPSVNYEEGEEQIQLNQDLAHPAAPPSLLASM